MADMNKRPGGRRSEVEDDLVGQTTDQQALMETGKDKNVADPYSLQHEKRYRKLNISHGHRYRHPDRVLHQYATINKDTEHAESVFEQALIGEDERTNLPSTYKPKGHTMVANQLGVSQIAEKNFASKKKKLPFMTNVVGI